MTIHYEFPRNVTLDEVREIVRDNPNFYIVDRWREAYATE